MPLKTTAYPDIVAHLLALGVRRGMDLMVQSQLTSFGILDGGPETVYRALRDTLGPEATIAVPAYRLHSGSDDVFDRYTSPSERVGVFCEFVRCLPGAVRSNCQMHSHAAVGPNAGLLDSVSGDISIGPGSDFAAMHAAGFHQLLLGGDFRIATFTIHVQAMHGGIPYRAWLDLPRPRRGANGEAVPAICRYYGRVRQGADEDFRIVGDALVEQGKVGIAPCAYGRSMLLSMSDFQECALQMLKDDPQTLIRERRS